MSDPAADPGLFGPDSVTWRVHREPIITVGGLRSLYLQALHPRAVAGVEQNSRYREDPWGRLARTSTYVTTVVYGTTEEAERAGKRVRAIHGRMTAVDRRTGELFRIDEPELLRWVHVTEVESFLTAAQRGGLRLTPAEADEYYREQTRTAALAGLDPATVPDSVAAVTDYYARMRPSLELTVDSAATGLFLTVPPLPWGLGLTPVRGVSFGVSALAIGLLPGWARRLYGLPGLGVTDRVASVNALILGRLMRSVPIEWIESPARKRAMERLGLRH
ncbi:oxygenase MpaB family protein [Dactylosporangium sp. CA-092794]|uniref:oxygenase MpaB family protein n=1 Tax=Dactylosporangium sp. CA-092794 TaxID=3239929 RepID=UPI003D947BF6